MCSAEPSVVAMDLEEGVPLAVGKEAKLMLGRTRQHKSSKTIKRWLDFDAAEQILNIYSNVMKEELTSPKNSYRYSKWVTSVERRAVEKASGAREVHLIDEPVAAAIGASLPVTEPIGTVVDIGGTTEVAVLSLGGTVLLNPCE